MSDAILSACGLHKSYDLGRRKVEVLHGVSLEIASGDFLSLQGASGAGKSTLLHLLGGLDEPSAGEVFADGQSLLGMGAARLAKWRNREVGFVFQAYHLLPEFDALENVLIPARIAHTSVAIAERRGRELLERVGLAKRMNHLPTELSGGEQQRV
ncbi:MAG: ATP-binding cassette domain-containing protein, partial [Verrucomicrobiales bacterium]|nr:ATP-binding cassette domain-containing protein [Verrucomicrobiales bacterium]